MSKVRNLEDPKQREELELEYMISRSLPLLLTEATRKHREQSEIRGRATGIQLSTVDASSIDIYQDVLTLLHAIKIVDLCRLRLLPACDRDMPAYLESAYHFAPVGQSGLIDFQRTIASGALGRGEACFASKRLNFRTHEAETIALCLRKIICYAESSTSRIDRVLAERNAFVRRLSVALQELLGALHREIGKRPVLASLVSKGTRSQRLSRARKGHRSVQLAMRLLKYCDESDTTTVVGDSLPTKVNLNADQVYEFWCFCELTRRLLVHNKYNIIQKSLLRSGLKKPVFTFGSECFVYYEHRGDFFRRDGGRDIHMWRNFPKRGPEWFIMRGDSVNDSIVIDCKHYKTLKAGMYDCVSLYCQDYGAHTGVVMVACEPRQQESDRGNSAFDNHYRKWLFPNSSMTRYDLHLRPEVYHESRNEAVLDKFINSIGV